MDNPQTKYWHLEKFNVIKSLPMKDRVKLKEIAKMKTFTKGSPVYFSNDVLRNVYFLKEGNVKISKITTEGKELLLEVIGPGELFGGVAFSEDEGQNEAAVALKDCLVCYLDVESWNNFMKNHSAFNLSILKLTGFKIKKLQTRIEQLQFLNTNERIKVVLKELTDKHAKKIGAGFEQELRLNLTHSDLAKLTGTSRQTVTTVMNNLQQRGVISYNQRRILIRKYEELAV